MSKYVRLYTEEQNWDLELRHHSHEGLSNPASSALSLLSRFEKASERGIPASPLGSFKLVQSNRACYLLKAAFPESGDRLRCNPQCSWWDSHIHTICCTCRNYLCFWTAVFNLMSQYTGFSQFTLRCVLEGNLTKSRIPTFILTKGFEVMPMLRGTSYINQLYSKIRGERDEVTVVMGRRLCVVLWCNQRYTCEGWDP